MSVLFEPLRIGPMKVKNRFARSATGESRADREGVITDTVLPIYDALAGGGVGLIISGHMYVHPEWKCSPAQTGIWDDKHLAGLRRLATAATANDTRAVAQINYAPRPPADLEPADTEEAIQAFVAAALRAQAAGFDGVQIHAAHGYLISGFLTPAANPREDEYGKDPEGRRRLLLQVTRRVRDAVGPNMAVLCKLGVVDGRDNSLGLAESVDTAGALQDAGIDAIEVSTAFSGPHANPVQQDIDAPEKEAYFAEQARAVRESVSVPVLLVGGLRSLPVMERVVEDGACDMVSLARPFIREPDLVNAMREGRTQRVACISCNKCYNPRGFRCVFAE